MSVLVCVYLGIGFATCFYVNRKVPPASGIFDELLFAFVAIVGWPLFIGVTLLYGAPKDYDEHR